MGRLFLSGTENQMKFKITHQIHNSKPEYFTETTAPNWLTSCNTVKGSTMDDRWFWNEHVLTLEVGKEIETDFQLITRIS